MDPYRLKHHREGRSRLEVPHRGQRLLRHAMYSKGTAFTREERAALGLDGLLPDAVSTGLAFPATRSRRRSTAEAIAPAPVRLRPA